MYWKDRPAQGRPAHPRNTENPSIWGRARRASIEMKQFSEVWRSCTRDNVEADESYFVLNPAADRTEELELKTKQNTRIYI